MIIDEIISKYPNAVCQCSERKCKANFDRFSHHAVLKGEKLTPNEAICDCIVFENGKKVWIYLIELKSRSLKPNSIKKKFCNGAFKAQSILNECGYFGEYGFSIILLAKSYSNAHVHTRLKAAQIPAGLHSYPIMLGSCGDKLHDLRYHNANALATK